MIGCFVFAGLLFGAIARHHHCHHHRGHHWRDGFRRHRRRRMWSLLERLDLTPSQERLVQREVDELRGAFAALRPEARATRDDLARAFRGEALDEEVLAAMAARQEEKLAGLRGALRGALERLHAGLEPGQRESLADLIGRERERGGAGGPYR